MIDTVKIYTLINKEIYEKVKSNSIVKTSYHNSTGEIYYNIVNDHLQGSYDSSLSVRVDNGAKYGFANQYFIEIEGSLHKIIKGYNSHNGFYNLYEVCSKLISFVENSYNIVLPIIKHWFLQRVDIAICFDLSTQKNVINYLNNLHSCDYPRRTLRNYGDFGGTGIYYSGSSTTLKIYNKYQEFKKHDLKNFKNSNFDIINYLKIIEGFIRFEVEIKKKKLVSIYDNKYVRVRNVSYKDLKKIWCDEFMKLLKIFDNDLKKVRSKEKVEKRLNDVFGNLKGSRLYNFYLSIIIDGLDTVRKRTKKSVYYRNIADLKSANIDFSQKIDIDFDDCLIDFDPFSWKEVV